MTAKVVTAAALLVLCISCTKEQKPAAADQQSPEQAYREFQQAVARGDLDGIWRFISDKSKQWLVRGNQVAKLKKLQRLPDAVLADLARVNRVTVADLKKMSLEQLARAVMVAEAMKNKAMIVGAKVKSVKEDRDGAIVTTTAPNGGEEVMVLVREKGTWKLDGKATMRQRAILKRGQYSPQTMPKPNAGSRPSQ